ncbi:hypothetical protein [Streptomyces sp. NPDC018833]|uniref:hypothetical protein n=1 Tax=Streptomyces sp. NPDC018833 TaxID=3365053 RepID=UPI0037AF7663
MKQVSKFLADFARRAARSVRAAARKLALRQRFERHRRELRLRLLYGAVSAFGSWGAGILITYMMTRR